MLEPEAAVRARVVEGLWGDLLVVLVADGLEFPVDRLLLVGNGLVDRCGGRLGLVVRFGIVVVIRVVLVVLGLRVAGLLGFRVLLF